MDDTRLDSSLEAVIEGHVWFESFLINIYYGHIRPRIIATDGHLALWLYTEANGLRYTY